MSSVPGWVAGAVGLALERLVLGRLREAGGAHAVDARLRVGRGATGRRGLVDVRRLSGRLLGTRARDQEADHVVVAVAELDVLGPPVRPRGDVAGARRGVV